MALNDRLGSDAGLRERKKAHTKALLQETALKLFREKGFSATSVDEIAAAADVSRSTFFRYFGSKEAVLFGDFEETGGLLTDLLEARPVEEAPIQAFEEALLEVSDRTGFESRRSYSRMFEEVVREDAGLEARRFVELDRWTGRIAESFARREQRPVTSNDTLAAATCLTVVEQIGRRWRQSPDITAVQTIKETFQTLREMTR